MNKKFFHSELKRARNFGAAGHGVTHWLQQRFTALILILLVIWLAIFTVNTQNISMTEFKLLLSQPLNFTCLIVFVVTALYHGMLGMQIIIEDYVACLKSRFALIIALKIFTLVTAIATVISQCFFVFR